MRPPIYLYLLPAGILLSGCERAAASHDGAKDAAVTLSSALPRPNQARDPNPLLEIYTGDSVTFTAHIRPDLAADIKRTGGRGDSDVFVPRIVGWHWISDLDNTDTTTKACPTLGPTCTIEIGMSGTMVFSIQTHDQICADWVHIEVSSLPEITEEDTMPRIRDDSIRRAIKTKAPTWQRCTA